MSNRDNIEDIFNDAFSNWEPEVPGNVKTNIDDEIVRGKPGFISRFRYALVALFVVLTTVLTWIFTNPTPTDLAQNQENNEALHSQSHTRDSKDTLSSQKNGETKSTELSSEESEYSPSEDIAKATQIDVQTDRRQTDAEKRKAPKSIPSGKVGRNSKSSASKLNSSPQTQGQAAVLKDKDLPNWNQNSSISTNSTGINIADNGNSGKEATNVQHNPNELESVETVNSYAQKNISQNSSTHTVHEEQNYEIIASNTGSEVTTEAMDSVVSNNLNNPPLANENLSSFTKGFMLGAQIGLHSGRNSITDNLGTFTESRNLGLGLDLSYHFLPRHRLSSGLYYQRRTEQFQQNIALIDSTLISTEPIVEMIIAPNGGDTTFVVVGYNNIYDYDTNFVSAQNAAHVQLFMLPLAYDFKIFGLKNHALWIRSGANIGVYRTSNEGNFPNFLNLQNSFSMQLFARPYYAFSLGKIEAGVFGNFVYDAMLPQAYPFSRSRWQMGYGLQVTYRL